MRAVREHLRRYRLAALLGLGVLVGALWVAPVAASGISNVLTTVPDISTIQAMELGVPSSVLDAAGDTELQLGSFALTQEWGATPEGFAVPATVESDAAVAGSSLTGASVSAALGAGVASFMVTSAGLRLAHVYDDGDVCANTGSDFAGSMLRAVTGADCGTWQKTQEQLAAANGDLPSGPGAGTQVCDSAGGCLTITGWTYSYNGSNQLECASVSDTSMIGEGTSGLLFGGDGTGTYSSGVQRQGECGSASGDVHVYMTSPSSPHYPATMTIGGGPTASIDASSSRWDIARQYRCLVFLASGGLQAGAWTTSTEGTAAAPDVVCPTPTGVVSNTMIQEQDDQGGSYSWSNPTTTAYQNWASNYPQCLDGSCALDLQQKQSDGSWLDCFTSTTACAGWFSDSSKADDYRCVYAGDTLALAECNPYATTWDPASVGSGHGWSDTSGNPITKKTTKTTTEDDPTATATPTSTAADSPSSSPTDSAGVGVTPGGSDDPSASAGSDPSVGTTTTPTSDPSSDGGECMGTFWSNLLNPVDWVLIPVKCALEWAFVPDPTTVESDMGTVDDAWKETYPGRLIGAIGAINFTGANVSGCDGITYDVEVGDGVHMKGNLLNACGAPLNQLATLSSVFIGLIAVLGTIFSVSRSIGGIVAFPGLGGGE